jgi:hypothetical protein
MTNLPCEQLKAELSRLCRDHRRSLDDGEMEATWRDGMLCIAVTFPDGMAWEVPFDAGAQDIVQGLNATKH